MRRSTVEYLLLQLVFPVCSIFMQLAFNFSSRVTDTLESYTILIYSRTHEFISAAVRQDTIVIKWLIKSIGMGSSRGCELKV